MRDLSRLTNWTNLGWLTHRQVYLLEVTRVSLTHLEISPMCLDKYPLPRFVSRACAPFWPVCVCLISEVELNQIRSDQICSLNVDIRCSHAVRRAILRLSWGTVCKLHSLYTLHMHLMFPLCFSLNLKSKVTDYLLFTWITWGFESRNEEWALNTFTDST